VRKVEQGLRLDQLQWHLSGRPPADFWLPKQGTSPHECFTPVTELPHRPAMRPPGKDSSQKAKK
jgi:hypothetical protein